MQVDKCNSLETNTKIMLRGICKTELPENYNAVRLWGISRSDGISHKKNHRDLGGPWWD